MFLVLFVFVNLAPSSRLRHLSVGLTLVDILDLAAGRGPKLLFVTLVDQIESRRCFCSRF